MENIENIFKSLSYGCLKILFYMANKNGSISPSQVAVELNIDRRRVEYCLNNFVKGGLIVKVSRGVYKISRKGVIFINILNNISNEDHVLVWSDNGFDTLTIDFLQNLLGDTISSTQLNSYLTDLKKHLSLYGYVSVEYLLLYLCHILFREGYEAICNSISKKIMFSPVSDTILHITKYRKTLESSIIGHVAPLLKEKILEIDDPKYLFKYHILFLPKKRLFHIHNSLDDIILLTSEVVVNVSDTSYLDSIFKERCVMHATHLTINLYEDDFTPEINDYYRDLMNNIQLSLIIHGGISKIVEDELSLHTLYNNLKYGMDILFVNDKYFPHALVSKNGFSMSLSDNISIINLIIKLDVQGILERKYQSIFLESGVSTILKYNEIKRKLVNFSIDNLNDFIFLLLTNFKNVWKSDRNSFIQFIKEIQDRFKEQYSMNNLMIGLDESIYDENANILFVNRIPPLSNIIVDINDLRYTLAKFYKSDYPIIRLFSRS